MFEDVTAAELGELIGVSARAVANLGARGIAVKAGPGRWKLKESVARYCDDMRRQAKGVGGEGAAVERGRLASAQADLVALKVARQRDEVLDAKTVEREWSSILTTVRSGMLALPSRVGARLPQLTPGDVAEVDREVRAVLMELGHDGAR
jgi:phage terminase Nu1 subunit (DNA packaging protein)